MNKNPEWGGHREGAGRPRRYIKVPIETFIGEGTKIEVFSVSEKAHFYHIEGQGLTTVDDIYRGSTSDLLTMLLEPIGCTVNDHRIIQASLS